AEPCKEIDADKSKVYEYTTKSNLVAEVSDGTAVLGLGDIGPEAAMPVMEGKCVLFKSFAGVDAFPICVDTTEIDEVVQLVKWLEPTFGGVNLEDISAPRCFEIEARLKAETNIPVFHDDQHGTAVVVGAGLLNALKVVGKEVGDVTVAVCGAGSAGTAVAKFLLSLEVEDVIMVDKFGILHPDVEEMNPAQRDMALKTNKSGRKGPLAEALRGADAFVGVSAPGLVSTEMVETMADDAIIFAMANPVPEIYPDEALAGGARVIGTGRSDYPNQVNNVLAFPGILRGALDVRARDINEEMKVAAAYALAGIILESELSETNVIPAAFDRRVAPAVAAAVARAAIESGVAQAEMDPAEVAARTEAFVEKANRFFD
ncbi:MAG: NADP-dependent malic enzyme, partial [Bacillota bacterium]